MNEDHRRFGLADALILTAGIAAGLGLVRLYAPGLTPELVWTTYVGPQGGMTSRLALEALVELGSILGSPFLVGWTSACLVVQILKFRARWRRLRRQPGFIACAVPLLVTVAIYAVMVTASLAFRWNPVSSLGDPYVFAYITGIFAGPSVLASWATLSLTGVCRTRPMWTDRLGRLTGVAWALIGVLVGVGVFGH